MEKMENTPRNVVANQWPVLTAPSPLAVENKRLCVGGMVKRTTPSARAMGKLHSAEIDRLKAHPAAPDRGE